MKPPAPPVATGTISGRICKISDTMKNPVENSLRDFFCVVFAVLRAVGADRCVCPKISKMIFFEISPIVEMTVPRFVCCRGIPCGCPFSRFLFCSSVFLMCFLEKCDFVAYFALEKCKNYVGKEEQPADIKFNLDLSGL